jgi:hypothetical protein
MADSDTGRAAISAPLVQGRPGDAGSAGSRDDGDDDGEDLKGPAMGAGAAAAAPTATATATAFGGPSAGLPSMSTLTLVTLVAAGRDVVGMASRKERSPEEAREVRRSMEVLRPLAQQVLDKMSEKGAPKS